MKYDELLLIINTIICKNDEFNGKIEDEESIYKKNIRRKNEDSLYEMMYRINAYVDDDKKDVTRLILK